MQMKTLTINGQTFIIVDADAIKKDTDASVLSVKILSNKETADGIGMTGSLVEDKEGMITDALTLIGDINGEQVDTNLVILRGLHDGEDPTDAATVRQVETARKEMVKNGDDPLFVGLTISDEECERGAWVSPEPYEKYGDISAAVLEFFGVLGDEPTILRNIVCVEDGDAANKGYVDGLVQNLQQDVGEIETALDSIIAIQESLIGIITFAVGGISVTALKGMTWSEWCDSQYNINGVYVGDDGIVYDDAGDTLALDDVVQYDTMALVDGADYFAL